MRAKHTETFKNGFLFSLPHKHQSHNCNTRLFEGEKEVVTGWPRPGVTAARLESGWVCFGHTLERVHLGRGSAQFN